MNTLQKKQFIQKPYYLFPQKPRKKPKQLISEYQRSRFYEKISKRSPHLIYQLLEELLQVECYSEIEIAFGIGVPIDIIRGIINRTLKRIPPHIFFRLLTLYVRIFGESRFLVNE